jgi:predicted SAM-dependent methyltransferase
MPVHLIKRVLKIFNDKKINMGCGATYLTGWINIDGNPFRKKDLWLDLRRKWPFRSETISGFVAAHVIEHLYDEELRHFFSELKRVLKKGAFVHIEVPSLELLIEHYSKDRNGGILHKN